jgi:hypothetical protein
MCTTPRPGVTEDGLRDDVERSGFRTMIGSPDTNESFVFVFFVFGVLDDNVPVTIFVKTIRVEEFEFADLAIAVEALLGETFVGIFRVRVFVEIFHVRMRGGRILKVSGGRERDGQYKVIVHLLDVFAMIS